MRFQTLTEWLAWQETLHPSPIELGLDRVRVVRDALGLQSPPYFVCTVGGTNGKGSVAAYLEATFIAAGYATGAYFSPHLVRYNERIRINGVEADDATLCEAFARVDAARGATRLTYFEFGTLAALDIFRRHAVQVAVLEVGLGGRLDAVNVLDADVAVVNTIGIDHTDWLGVDREAIGREKAGIFRAGRPAICGDAAPPASLRAQAAALGADLRLLGQDFHWQEQPAHWDWQGRGWRLADLPFPALPGAFQLANAAAALAALEAAEPQWPVTPAAIATGLRQARLAGRLQTLPGSVPVLLDVAHNPQAAQALAAHLQAQPIQGRTLLVLGMLADKDAAGVGAALAPQVAGWFLGGLGGPRGLSAAALAARLPVAAPACFADIPAAYSAALAAAQPGDRIVVCGSFHTVGAVLEQAAQSQFSR